MEGSEMFRGASKIHNCILSIFKVFSLFLFALLLPRLFVTYVNTQSYNNIPLQQTDFRLGLENISNNLLYTLDKSANETCNATLITNHTGKDQLGRTNKDILTAKGITIKKIVDPTEIIHQQNFENIQLIIFDMDITGIHACEHVNALFNAIDTACELNKQIIVLDRPNMMGPIIEGPLGKKNHTLKNAVTLVPLRYGMTAGEIALFYNNNIRKKPAHLHIVPMKNYIRDNPIASTALSDTTDLMSCHGHSFLGLLKEIEPFYVGTETKSAYQLLLLPEDITFPQAQWQKIHKILQLYGVKSNFYTYFNEEKKIHYHGLKIKIENINYTPLFKLLIHVLNFFKDNGVTLTFSEQFDQLVGTKEIRKFFKNKISWRKFSKNINKRLYTFYNAASSYFMYKPFPRIEYLS